MKAVKLKVVFDEDGPEVDLEGEFSDEDIDLFRDFIRHVDAIKSTKVISENFPNSLSISWTKEVGPGIEAEEFDVEYIDSFLHKLRPLILHREPASFNRITGVVKKFGNAELKAWIKKLHFYYKNGELNSFGRIVVNTISIFDDKTLDLWLNSSEYHQDDDKKEFKRRLEEALSAKGAKAFFVLRLREKANAIFVLSRLVQDIVDY